MDNDKLRLKRFKVRGGGCIITTPKSKVNCMPTAVTVEQIHARRPVGSITGFSSKQFFFSVRDDLTAGKRHEQSKKQEMRCVPFLVSQKYA